MMNKHFVFAGLWFAISVWGFLFADPSRFSFGYMVSPNFNFFSTHVLDKIVHFAVFFLQAWLLCKAWFEMGKAIPKNGMFWVLVAYGAIIELLQKFVFTERSGDVIDLVADLLGVLAAFWLFESYRKARTIRDAPRKN